MSTPPLQIRGFCSTFLAQIPIDEDELRTALRAVAVPGYRGSLQVEIGLRPSADGKSFFIEMAVLRRERKRPGANAEKQLLPDMDRRKKVEDVIEELRTKLFVRPILQAVEVQFENGMVTNYHVAE